MKFLLAFVLLAFVAVEATALTLRSDSNRVGSPRHALARTVVSAPAPARPRIPTASSVSTARPLLLATFDADGDGKLSAAEITNASRILRFLDANGDGQLTANEFPTGPRN